MHDAALFNMLLYLNAQTARETRYGDAGAVAAKRASKLFVFSLGCTRFGRLAGRRRLARRSVRGTRRSFEEVRGESGTRRTRWTQYVPVRTSNRAGKIWWGASLRSWGMLERFLFSAG
jgi:hypothetical protein